MKLFKKLMVALSVLLVIGMLAACSDGSKSKSATREGWDIYYNEQSILGEPEEDDEPMTWEDVQMGITMYGLTEGTDYSVNQSSQILTLTKSGYDKMEAMENAMENAMSQLGDDDDIDSSSVYTVKYNGTTVTTVPEALLPMYALILEEDTDYTINESTKTITLTAAGYAKMKDYEDDED